MRTLLRFFRYLCFFAFAVVGSAAIITGIVELTNACPGFSANTGLSCGGAWYEGIANVAMGLLLYSLLTLVPAVLAIAGLIFAIIALVRRKPRAA
jgi:hypothetical protein